MNNWRQFEKSTMETLAKEFENLQIPVKLYEPDEQSSTYVLVSLLEGLGEKGEHDVKLEMLFLPLDEGDREVIPFNFIQFFAVIKENVNEASYEALMELINDMNSKIPVGSLGISTDSKILYLKYCCPFIQDMASEMIITMADAIISLIIQELNTFIDTLIDTADKRLKKGIH